MPEIDANALAGRKPDAAFTLSRDKADWYRCRDRERLPTADYRHNHGSTS